MFASASKPYLKGGNVMLMTKKSTLLIFVTTISVIAAFTFASEALAKQMLITIGGGGRAFQPVAGGVAELINKNVEGVQATAQGTNAGVDNVKLMDAEQNEMGCYCTDVAWQAQNGMAPFTKRIDSFANIGWIFKNHYNVLVKKKSGVRSYEELSAKGLTIAAGAVGSGMLEASKMILPLLGIDPKNMKEIGYGPGGEAFKDDRVGAIAFQTPNPYTMIMELATSHDLVFLSMSEDQQKRICEKYPFNQPRVLQAGLYRLQDYPVNTVGLTCLIGCQKSLPEDLVYQITKVVYSEKGISYMHKVNAILQPLTVKNSVEWAMQKQVTPIHPGALKWYKELANKLGMEWKPAR
jgi:TRAP transporter TAXI family solute receptor